MGNLLLIKEDEPFPADILLLSSSAENAMAFIQTSTLDGEKNLKPKSSLTETNEIFKNHEKLPSLEVLEKYEFGAKEPDQNLYTFEGHFKNENNKTFMLGPKQFLLRGGYLKNTKWIIGVIVYTGNDTKLMRNAEPSKIKTSAVERKTNNFIIGILVFQFILTLSLTFNHLFFYRNNSHLHFYLPLNNDKAQSAFLIYFTYFLLMNTMLPISLIGI